MTNTVRIGIDQSFTKTGMVINFNDGQRIEHKLLFGFKSDEPYSIFRRAKEMAKEILQVILRVCNEYPLYEVKILLEGLSFGSSGPAAAANRDLAGLQFLIMSELLEQFEFTEIAIIAPTSLKKFATGKGNCDKESMVEYIKEKSPDFYDVLMKTAKSKGRYDLADAYWLSVYK